MSYKFCPYCGERLEEEDEYEPTKEQLEEEARLDRLFKHEKSESYRQQYYKKKGWKFKPKPFIED